MKNFAFPPFHGSVVTQSDESLAFDGLFNFGRFISACQLSELQSEKLLRFAEKN
jgi:hypothetical protein